MQLDECGAWSCTRRNVLHESVVTRALPAVRANWSLHTSIVWCIVTFSVSRLGLRTTYGENQKVPMSVFRQPHPPPPPKGSALSVNQSSSKEVIFIRIQNILVFTVRQCTYHQQKYEHPWVTLLTRVKLAFLKATITTTSI